MDRKELEVQIIDMIATIYNKDAEALSVDTNMREELTGSSVLMVALVSEIENELDVMIQLADAAACTTIGDLIDKVEAEL
jgi:acyl carrier protein